jgi:hypothetical protein
MSQNDRRKQARMGVSLAVRIQGHASDGSTWGEMSTTNDASQGGASFALQHAVQIGHVLHLSLPLPKRLRHYDLVESSYRVWALVRDVTVVPQGQRVGVMFLGKQPPRGFEQNPSGRYLMPQDAPSRDERRQHPRVDVALSLRLRRTDPMAGLAEERTLTENVGRGGVRVMTGMPVAKGEVLVVEGPNGDTPLKAEIRNLYIGQDGVPRLNLCFLDAELPSSLMQAAGVARS